MPEIDIREEINANSVATDMVVFSGGGAKGAIYSGVYEGLTDSGIMPDVKAIAGSSAGAIAASLVAIGVKPETYKKVSQDENLKALMGDKGFNLGPIMLGKDAEPLRKLLIKHTNEAVSEFFIEPNLNLNIEQINENFINRLDFLQETRENLKRNIDHLVTRIDSGEKELKNELKFLKSQLEPLNLQIKDLTTIISRDNQTLDGLFNNSVIKSIKQRANPTLGDLAMLRCIAPDRFKDLNIMVTDKETSTLRILNAETAGNISIADACIASSAIPGVFISCTINGIVYVDGGVANNIPIFNLEGKISSDEEMLDKIEFEELTNNPEKSRESKHRILAFAFKNDQAHIAVFGSKDDITNPSILKIILFKIITVIFSIKGMKNYFQDSENTYQDLRNNALNTVILDTGNVGTLSFDEAQRLAPILHLEGKVTTLEYFQNHNLSPDIIPNLDYMRFIVDVAKEYATTKADGKQSHIEKLNQDIYKAKLDALLEMANPEIIKTMSREKIIDNIIKIASVPLSNKQADNKFIEAAIKILNDTTISLKIKGEIMKEFGIDPKKQDIARYKFTPETFGNLQQNQQRPITHKNLREALELPAARTITVR
jgi:NTE family protein